MLIVVVRFFWDTLYICIVTAAGDHTVDITLRDNTVDCSPFMFKVYDNAQIIVSNIPAQSVLGKPVSFGSQSLFLPSL